MSQVATVPFIRLSIPFGAGIALYDAFGYRTLPEMIGLGFFVLLIVFSLFVLKLIPLPPYRFRFLTGILIFILITIAGYQHYALIDRTDPDTLSWLALKPEPGQVVALAIAEQTPEKKARTYAARLRVVGVIDSGLVYRSVHLPVMAFFASDTSVERIFSGDTLLISGQLNLVPAPLNPATFNYQKYLRRKGISYSIYLDSGQWELNGKGNPGFVRRTTHQIRKYIHQVVHHSALQEENKGLALALLIGLKDDLDPEVSQEFSGAGAVHVLCVSGLHVGVIYLMIIVLFGFLRKIRKYGHILFFAIGIAGIWSYAMVAGLPPSVNRASVMFSFMLLGKLFRRKNISMNGVAASAFLLMFEQPGVIFHVGFQLSYLAVIGIITMFPPLSQIWMPGNRWLVKIRDLILVSFCAQLFTFPVAVSLFHTFPNYFLLTNLLIIPVTGVVIYAGVAFLTIQMMPLHQIAEVVFDWLLSLMRMMVGFVDGLPGSSTNHITISNPQVWIIMISIFALLFWMQREGRRFLLVSLAGVLIAVAMGLANQHQHLRQESVIVYHLKRASVVDIMQGFARTTFQGSDSIPDRDLAFSTEGFRLKSGVMRNHQLISTNLIPRDTLIIVKNASVKFLFVNGLPYPGDQKLRVDYALISGSLYPDSSFFDSIDAATWIVDGSVPFWKVQKWKLLAVEHRQTLWDTAIQGACLIR
jgi:competence protein ComEC